MSHTAGPNSATRSGGTNLRIDTDHHLVEMMQTAVNRLQNKNISVQMTEDHVLLSGSVNSWSAKQTAQESIRKMTAARSIQNDLAVVGY